MNRRVGRAFAAPVLCLLVCGVLPGCQAGARGPEPDPDAVPPAAQRAEELASLRTARAEQPAEPYWSFRIGRIYAAADSVVQAEEALTGSLELDPAYPPAVAALSELYFHSGRHREAVELIESARTAWTATRREPFPDALTGALALNLEAAGDAERAEAMVEDFRRQGRDVNALASVSAYVLLRGEGFERAAGPAERAVRADRANAVRQNNYGITLLQAGRPDEAETAFLEARNLNPDLPGPLYNLAILEKFYRTNDEAARGWFELYARLADEDPDNLRGALYAPPEETP